MQHSTANAQHPMTEGTSAVLAVGCWMLHVECSFLVSSALIRLDRSGNYRPARGATTSALTFCCSFPPPPPHEKSNQQDEAGHAKQQQRARRRHFRSGHRQFVTLDWARSDAGQQFGAIEQPTHCLNRKVGFSFGRIKRAVTQKK